jgi:hypothetical protein
MSEEAPAPTPEATETIPPGMRGERKTKPRRVGRVGQCIYIDKEFHARAVAYAKANKEHGWKPDTFSGLVQLGVELFMAGNPLPAFAGPPPPPPPETLDPTQARVPPPTSGPDEGTPLSPNPPDAPP